MTMYAVHSLSPSRCIASTASFVFFFLYTIFFFFLGGAYIYIYGICFASSNPIPSLPVISLLRRAIFSKGRKQPVNLKRLRIPTALMEAEFFDWRAGSKPHQETLRHKSEHPVNMRMYLGWVREFLEGLTRLSLC